MNWITQLFRRRQMCDDLSEEISEHLEEKAEELMAAGMSREEAWAAAHRQFGDVTQVEEFSREAWQWPAIETVFVDARFGLRMLRKNPGFTAVVILTLAIGIGANTAIFSVINAVLLRPFSYPHPERLVTLSERAPGLPLIYIAMANLEDWRSQNTVFEGLEGFRETDVAFTGHGDPQHLAIRQVSAGFFPLLGVKPILGRPISAQDDKANAKPVVLLGDSFWAREFGRDPGILHKQLVFNGEAYTVIGVIPSSRCHLTWRKTDAFTPLGLVENAIGGPMHHDTHSGIWAYARLKSGVTIEQARAEMARIAEQLEKQYPKTNLGQRVNVAPLLQRMVRDARRPLLLLMGAVGLVLLIACANVANLLMSQAVVRRREIAVRSALGAGAARLARQQLCESILLALIGGAVGLLVAYAATAALGHLATSTLPRIEEVSIDKPVLLFTLGVSLFTGIVFGVFPALMALRIDPNEVLKDASHGSRAGLTRVGMRSALAAGELALSLVLLVGAGLTIKSLFHVLQADVGFQANGVLTASLLDTKFKNEAQRRHFVEQFVEKLAALPGVKAAGIQSPLLGGAQTDIRVEGRPQPEPGAEPYVEISGVTPGALEALSIKLAAGRYFNAHDKENAQPVCIIDDSLAQQYWPGESALGKRIDPDMATSLGVRRSWRTVVGVVHRIKNYGAGKPSLPGVYLPYAQYARRGGALVVLSDLEQSSLEPMVHEVLYSLDPDLPLYDVSPLAEAFDIYIAPQRLAAVLLGILAGIALLLAAVGTYGVMAYMVAGRTPEIGVRRALGAKPADVLRLVLGHGMRVALAGLLAGILVSLGLGGAVSPMLFGVKASDPMTFASVGALLMAVAVAACCIPARRAMGLDPIEAVRHE